MGMLQLELILAAARGNETEMEIIIGVTVINAMIAIVGFGWIERRATERAVKVYHQQWQVYYDTVQQRINARVQ
jgi:hypothetical protein